jgi:hypothetical protein
MRSKTVLILGKAPGGKAAARAVLDAEKACDVAVINDAGKLLRPTDRIDWCFWTDGPMFAHCGEFQKRVGCFVSPVEPPAPPDWYNPKRHVFYGDRACGGDVGSLAGKILSGGICHHHTTPGAIHWLAKHAWYRRFILCGISGQPGLEDGVWVSPTNIRDLNEKEGPTFRQDWHRITRTACDLVQRVYAVSIEWR